MGTFYRTASLAACQVPLLCNIINWHVAKNSNNCIGMPHPVLVQEGSWHVSKKVSFLFLSPFLMLEQIVPPHNVLLSKTSFLQNILPQNVLPQNVLRHKTTAYTKHPPIQNILPTKRPSYKTSFTT
jgi:hypothetical protein